MPRKSTHESLADADAAPGGVAAVDRALTLLGAFRQGDGALPLAELATRTQLHKSTALRLLASLEHARWVQRLADGRYALGPEVARLYALYAAAFSLDRVVLPVLRDLVAATGESAAYHVRQGDVRLCQFRVDSPHPVRDHIRAGDLLPLERGTGGRVLVAFDPAPGRVPGARDRALHARIRADGYAASVGDRLDEVAGISAPVFHADGSLAAAVTLTMPAHRYDERYVKAVLEAARRLNGQV
ncbi:MULTISPECIES: IclR family transcriptional regulator [unclassified Acidovorax]|uniref:IclR family transcriptional regulator n=1 Tax=unclassified Acidovorax TaxID=2684926 RepID=UPI001C43C1ED|nr:MULTISPECIES: IclR family transcriptional regulator [unclassified Acidovorax]MBV7430860.1 IclR family transcriptional regulator [Acidovorax sp. sif0732]MBV7451966.1 IclR family transcriptional regulator [Acidovorax sp. sif0715]